MRCPRHTAPARRPIKRLASGFPPSQLSHHRGLGWSGRRACQNVLRRGIGRCLRLREGRKWVLDFGLEIVFGRVAFECKDKRNTD
jgi:hypothetical protein